MPAESRAPADPPHRADLHPLRHRAQRCRRETGSYPPDHGFRRSPGVPGSGAAAPRLISSRMYRDNTTSSPPCRHTLTMRPGTLPGYASPDTRTLVSSTTRKPGISALVLYSPKNRSQPDPPRPAPRHKLLRSALPEHQSGHACGEYGQTDRHPRAPRRACHPC
jgi:hypothetical protein